MAKVFVGIPTFNRPDYVQQTVHSLLAQTFQDWRAVVSDNCSEPASLAKVASFVAGLGDPRVTFHQQPFNSGEYGQGWFFFRMSVESELLVIVHDDDLLSPTCLAEAVAALDAQPGAAFFVANAYALDDAGRRSEVMTAEHLRHHGRTGVAEGPFDVLGRHMACGFAPISGAVFRRAELDRAGFVDADLSGNYPFECNLFLRLGEIGSTAWFSPKELLGVRYHPGSFRSTRYMRDPQLVATSIKMWERRHFTGALERRRRAVLSRYYRAQAEVEIGRGSFGKAQSAWLNAIRTRPTALRAWIMAPTMLRSMLIGRA